VEKKRVYIVVKTYPNISKKYAELVCTAGVLEDGSWIRLYPVPFRKLDIEQRYKKYSWIELDVERNTSDFRVETYRPLRLDTIKVNEKPRHRNVNWQARKEIIFKNKKIYTNITELIEQAKTNKISLAVFKPAKIIGFEIEPTDREWDKDKLEHLEAESRQLSLFQTSEEIEREFKVVKKVPYKFSYKFEDDSGRKSTLMITDWEIGMLYFHCLEHASGDEKVATAKVRDKYMENLTKKDLYFFLGTTKEYHNLAPNPFIIIGVFYPPIETQMDLFNTLGVSNGIN
jgi:hypothetical protein